MLNIRETLRRANEDAKSNGRAGAETFIPDDGTVSEIAVKGAAARTGSPPLVEPVLEPVKPGPEPAPLPTPSLVPPPTPESVFDNLEAARYLPSESGPVGRKVLTNIPVKKPEPHWFVRVHSALRFQALLYEDREERETYYAFPALEDTLERFGQPTLLVLAITTQATLFAWPLSLPGPYRGGGDLARRWHDSARKAAEIAERQWISLRSNRQAGAYDTILAEHQHAEPEWPDGLTVRDMLKFCFGDRVIVDAEHPVLRKLRGG